MRTSQRKIASRVWLLVAALGFLGILGCGRRGPTTYPVHGQVELAGAEVKLLAGSHVEAALSSDPLVRASGEIQEDGSFRLETTHVGAILNGACEGTYQLRIILTNDDQKRRRQAAQVLAPRFLEFDKSGLSFEVPTSGAITIALSQR